MRKTNCEKGACVTEFALILPFAMFLIFTVVGVSLMGTRALVAGLAAFRTGCVAKVFRRDLLDHELYGMLHPPFFRGGVVEQLAYGDGGNSYKGGEIAIGALSNSLIHIRSLNEARLIRRESPLTPPIVDGLSDSVLRGGDTPSPYCESQEGEGYRVCGGTVAW